MTFGAKTKLEKIFLELGTHRVVCCFSTLNALSRHAF